MQNKTKTSWKTKPKNCTRLKSYQKTTKIIELIENVQENKIEPSRKLAQQQWGGQGKKKYKITGT